MSGRSGLFLNRWRESAKESDKFESLDGNWQALKEKRRFPPVSSDGRHSAANLVDEIIIIIINVIGKYRPYTNANVKFGYNWCLFSYISTSIATI